MDFEEVIKKRHSVRSYLDKEVSNDLLEKILELANLSPSAGNLQARRIVIVKNLAVRQKLKVHCRGLGRFENEPPVIIVVCAVPQESAVRYEERGRNLYSMQDATIFASYLQLAASSVGLSSCWVGSFVEKEVSETLNLQEGIIPVAMVPIGYAKENLEPKPRKSLQELILKEI